MNRSFKKCFITGLSGSGGSYLADHILSKNKDIKIFGTYRSKKYYSILKKRHKNKIKFYKIDLTDSKELKKILKKINPDVIFNFASDANVRNSFIQPAKIINNNNSIVLNLLETLRLIKFKNLLIHCSTSEVYGNVPKQDQPITEKTKINPVNPYAVSKTFQDLLSQVYHKSYGLNIIITRMFSYMNPRRVNLFQTAFAKQIIEIEDNKRKFLYHGNLNSKRTIISTMDAMEAYWLTAKKGKIGEIYNICGSDTLRVGQFLKKLISKSKSKIITKVDKRLIRPVDIDLQIAECKKFKKHTGWKPKINIDESINQLINELRKKNEG
ncbi:GDP-mannose 4,6-dehydratase [Candidatus Pelagibacter sp. Uisw_136]|uniref:GDP-mannose 4,6-dehydratase n=1 Tax=Candidatus Pelagibacter sp. Uisw_136 TaxID=3230991 RepID=UPI0039E77FDD